MRSRITCLAILVTLFASARAADVRLAGSKLVLRKGPAAERLVLVARQDVIAPLPGSTEDPTLVGGELEIANPNTGESARFTTPARDWSVNALGTIFRFQNHLQTGSGSEVRTIVIKNHGRLKISTRALGITLDEETQQALSVVMRTGTRRYCFLFGGRIGKDKPGRFVAHKAPAPDACPRLIGGASTTTTSRPPGTRPTTTSVTSSTSTTSTVATLPLPSTTTTSTTPASSTTSTTNAPIPTTSTSWPPTPTTSSTTATVKPTTSTSTSTSSSTTTPPAPTTSSTAPSPTTTSTSLPAPTTTSTTPPPPTTTSTTSVPTTSTTTTTARPCGFRGNSCKGTCPIGLTCEVVLGLCTCVAP